MSDAELARLFEDLLNAESENSKTTATTTVLQQQERRGLDDNNTNDSFFSSNQQQQETYTFNRGSPSIDQQFENETTAAAPTEENESISTARAMDEIEERIEQQLQDVEAEAAARNSSSIGQSKEEEEDSKTKAAVAVQVVQKFARDFRVEDVKLAAASVGTISVVAFLASLVQSWFFSSDEEEESSLENEKQQQQQQPPPAAESQDRLQQHQYQDTYNEVSRYKNKQALGNNGDNREHQASNPGVLWQRREEGMMNLGGGGAGGEQTATVTTKGGGGGVLWTRRDEEEGEHSNSDRSSNHRANTESSGEEEANLNWEEKQNRALNNNVE
jgi:hypothetical protein